MRLNTCENQSRERGNRELSGETIHSTLLTVDQPGKGFSPGNCT
jgi:hypothetical protein